ncbi:hypothetical protein [Methylobacterium haplocladii]|uniref:Uncharacterized protein n=1 Tax=Methylobacterium haplocladii TaxID=1176176 RepID=A0A512IUM8_9HYPH|nr:hypothetical protein [Methylobacterium haplocladii]GEP01366.1 hypothetical protein MHA02_37530 [Methylobacterium haplocladii]GJD83832.1 hypothetical protein HPGCJGGD_1705 [Methylobacterium haplocladii]GLS58257.1 hypothetical protein GCM10007887_09150 [Methylobacterium haplocladii]
MSFILRAALAIGALSYFALQRDGSVPPTGELTAMAERQSVQITALAGALPTEMRAAATQAVTAELVKRLSTDTASRDTLMAVDRRPDWRGSDLR